jgi:hypothetical protein
VQLHFARARIWKTLITFVGGLMENFKVTLPSLVKLKHYFVLFIAKNDNNMNQNLSN